MLFNICTCSDCLIRRDLQFYRIIYDWFATSLLPSQACKTILKEPILVLESQIWQFGYGSNLPLWARGGLSCTSNYLMPPPLGITGATMGRPRKAATSSRASPSRSQRGILRWYHSCLVMTKPMWCKRRERIDEWMCEWKNEWIKECMIDGMN